MKAQVPLTMNVRTENQAQETIPQKNLQMTTMRMKTQIYLTMQMSLYMQMLLSPSQKVFYRYLLLVLDFQCQER